MQGEPREPHDTCLPRERSRGAAIANVSRCPFPTPRRLELTTPAALRFAWDVFELQTLLESADGAAPPPPRPGRHVRPRDPLPAAVMAAAGLDLFLSPAARSLYAAMQLEPRRNAPSARHRGAPARRFFARAVRLLQVCGRLSLEAVAPVLAAWRGSMVGGMWHELPLGMPRGQRAALETWQPLQLALLQIPPLLQVLGIASEDAAAALLPPPPALALLILADISSGHQEQGGVGGGARGDALWAQLMVAAPPLRRAMLRAAPELPFELVRRRDATRVRQLLASEPCLMGSLRDGGDDLLSRACGGRGLTHQIVSSMLRSGAFAACGGGSGGGCGGGGDDDAEVTLAARLTCVAAARAVRSQKTLRVLHAAWGPLMEARLVVVKPRLGSGGDDVVGLMLTLTLHAV